MAERAKPKAQPDGQARGPSLNELARESKDPKVEGIKKDIDSTREQRSGFVAKAKEYRRRLAYKEHESVVVARLVEAAKNAPKTKEMSIGYLKRLKSRLEFKISTEAKSLDEERSLVRKIDELNKRLGEAIATVRMGRKLEFVKKDIEQFSSGVIEADKHIAEVDAKLDVLYGELRRALGITARRERFTKKRGGSAPAPKVREINLEDIAIIKKKEAKHNGS